MLIVSKRSAQHVLVVLDSRFKCFSKKAFTKIRVLIHGNSRLNKTIRIIRAIRVQTNRHAQQVLLVLCSRFKCFSKK